MFLEDHETRRVIDKINGRVPEDAVLKDIISPMHLVSLKLNATNDETDFGRNVF